MAIMRGVMYARSKLNPSSTNRRFCFDTWSRPSSSGHVSRHARSRLTALRGHVPARAKSRHRPKRLRRSHVTARPVTSRPTTALLLPCCCPTAAGTNARAVVRFVLGPVCTMVLITVAPDESDFPGRLARNRFRFTAPDPLDTGEHGAPPDAGPPCDPSRQGSAGVPEIALRESVPEIARDRSKMV